MDTTNSLLPEHVNLDNALTQFSHALPTGLIEFIQEHVISSKGFLSQEKSFTLDLVLDTNIAFKEVRSLVVNKSSFLLKLIENPLLKVYAPTKLKEELLN